MYKILIVDDDPITLKDNRTYFESLGYEVVCTDTARAAEEIILSNALDCIILDVDLPDMNGFALCEKIRLKTSVPIIFLSGYTEEENRIRGLSIGGDDYVCKPYSLKELGLRAEARIRSGRAAQPPKTLTFGSFSICPASCSASYEDRSVVFSSYEFDVLYFLAKHPQEIYTPEQIYDSVWKAPINKGHKSLQVIMGRIRKKLYELCPDHDYIQTKRYKGYLFVPSRD
ncbi:response regulator transcription factor [Blautia schinkii]|nr:response regulator transcription factor [Blautia schinkii]